MHFIKFPAVLKRNSEEIIGSLNKSFYYRLSDSFTSPFILILTQRLENKEILSQITRHPLSAKMCSHFFSAEITRSAKFLIAKLEEQCNVCE